MNNLERDSKQYDVLVMEMSTQETTVRDSDWCVPVKHVAKLNRMRGLISTNTNIKFFVDPEEENEIRTQHVIVWDQHSSTCKTMSVTNAVVLRLMALRKRRVAFLLPTIEIQ